MIHGDITRQQAREQALRAAADLGHVWVCTEHTLLGLIRTEKSPAATILRDLGFTSDELRGTIATEIDAQSAVPE